MKEINQPILERRAENIEKYLKKYELSLYDLCRLFEVSVRGMHIFLADKDMLKKCDSAHHPRLVETLITKRQKKLSKGGFSPEILERYGLLRKPSRCAALDQNNDYMPDEKLQSIIYGARKKARKGTQEFLMDPKERGRVYELVTLLFDAPAIAEYINQPKRASELGAIVLACKKVMEEHIKAAYPAECVEALEDRRRMILKCSEGDELKNLVKGGLTIKDIVMHTGDSETVIRLEREKYKLEAETGIIAPHENYTVIYGDKVVARYKEIFDYYIANPDKMIEEIAKKYNITRPTFGHYITKYRDMWATDEEKEALEKRQRKGQELRMQKVLSSRQRNRLQKGKE